MSNLWEDKKENEEKKWRNVIGREICNYIWHLFGIIFQFFLSRVVCSFQYFSRAKLLFFFKSMCGTEYQNQDWLFSEVLYGKTITAFFYCVILVTPHQANISSFLLTTIMVSWPPQLSQTPSDQFLVTWDLKCLLISAPSSQTLS
jgi:hypothetical protein